MGSRFVIHCKLTIFRQVLADPWALTRVVQLANIVSLLGHIFDENSTWVLVSLFIVN